ncbi:uncharacterized protein TNCT_430601 [Trichonephila clavata]|uniref:Uncharacterized protein n=1 Tax=Trichonephila clavata TaxID=2740835 RepID=A0A8X6HWP9_TRICU|nr:uncharacterized protein TNCT_430601 [Trichonephila clavata]
MGPEIPAEAKVIQLKNLIESSDLYKDDIDFVRELMSNIQEEKRNEIELQKLKLSQFEKELELINAKKGLADIFQVSETKESSSLTDNLECLIRSVKVLTIPVPIKLESYNLFFQSLERAFENKSLPNKLKTEILLNILGEKVNNLLTYVDQEDLSTYKKIKELVLREFQPTPQECLNNFKRAQKQPSENYVQFASCMCASFNYKG